MTYAEQLAQVQAAITKIEAGSQSYSINTPDGSRSVSRADLATLYEREKWLRTMVDREARGGIRIRYGVTSC